MQDVTKTNEWKFLAQQAADMKKHVNEDTLILGDTVIQADGKTRPLNPPPAKSRKSK